MLARVDVLVPDWQPVCNVNIQDSLGGLESIMLPPTSWADSCSVEGTCCYLTNYCCTM